MALLWFFGLIWVVSSGGVVGLGGGGVVDDGGGRLCCWWLVVGWVWMAVVLGFEFVHSGEREVEREREGGRERETKIRESEERWL